jgi:FtsH-binding integral membrane protein
VSIHTVNQESGEGLAGRPAVISTDRTLAVFGQVMGLVALTLGYLARGACIGPDLSGGIGIAFFGGGVACVFALSIASARGHDQLSTTPLFGLGLLFGLALGPVLNSYAQADPSALWDAAGSTGAFVAGLGAYGYGTRRDLSAWGRTPFSALVGLIVFGLVALLVSTPQANVIWSVAGLTIFGAFTIFDLNRLRRAGKESAVRSPRASSWTSSTCSCSRCRSSAADASSWPARARTPRPVAPQRLMSTPQPTHGGHHEQHRCAQ